MTWEEHYAVNLAAYALLKDQIAATYPKDQFVAIAGGKIVADDADFYKLHNKLLALGVKPLEALVEKVGRETTPPNAFRGMIAMKAGGMGWNSETPTEGR